MAVSRGTVHYLPKATSPAELALMQRIDALHLGHPFMGARMRRRQLQRDGAQVGRRHIATLMRRMGIEALAPQPGTSKRAPGHKIYPYPLRTLSITRSNQVWALDTTYIPMARHRRTARELEEPKTRPAVGKHAEELRLPGDRPRRCARCGQADGAENHQADVERKHGDR
jgi:transposase InsO family protein